LGKGNSGFKGRVTREKLTKIPEISKDPNPKGSNCEISTRWSLISK
jgi:hypothetical protein